MHTSGASGASARSSVVVIILLEMGLIDGRGIQEVLSHVTTYLTYLPQWVKKFSEVTFLFSEICVHKIFSEKISAKVKTSKQGCPKRELWGL